MEREGKLTKLEIDAKEGGIATWERRPGGALLVEVGGGNVLCFERNGQRNRRGDFKMGDGEDVKWMQWNQECEWLGVLRGENEINVWAKWNWKWYQVAKWIFDGIAAAEWRGQSLYIYGKNGGVVELGMRKKSAGSEGLVIVVDGSRILTTDFSKGVLPPPLYHYAWDLGACGIDVGTLGRLVGARIGSSIEVKDIEANSGDKWTIASQQFLSLVDELRGMVMVSKELVVAIQHARRGEEVVMWERENEVGRWGNEEKVRVVERGVGKDRIVVVTETGTIVTLRRGENGLMEESKLEGKVGQGIVEVGEFEAGSSRKIIVTLDINGTLKASEIETGKILLVSNECSSFCVCERFLTYTTFSHLLYCAYMGNARTKSYLADHAEIPYVLDIIDGKHGEMAVEEGLIKLVVGKGATRPVDRGSTIVTAKPSDVALVLQAPRGNFETISPRPMVFEAVDKFAKSTDYGNAFRLCRRQRVDMNYIVDADYQLFLANIPKFITEVNKTSHLSIFLTFIKGSNEKVNAVCDAIVACLQASSEHSRFLNAILTGLIKRQPANIPGALDQLRSARQRSDEEGVMALDFLFVLLKDEEKVYEHALGTYDLRLALFVGKHSQLDPSEFSTELKHLNTLEEPMCRYSIDIRLRRYDSALRHLFQVGSDKYDECVALCHEHALYETGLQLFKDDVLRKRDLLGGFGKHLTEKKRYTDAAGVFVRIGEWKKAAESYREGDMWEMSLSAMRKSTESIEMKYEFFESLADELADNGKMKESANLRITYLDDFEGGMETLAKGGEWETLFEVVSTIYTTDDKDRGMYHAGVKETWAKVEELVLDGAEGMIGMLKENTTKVREKCQRLEAVRATKMMVLERLQKKAAVMGEEESDAFSSTAASTLVSNLSDVTFRSKSSVTSVYSTVGGSHVGPLSSAKLEKQAEKRRRRQKKKRVKEGDPREEEYLVGYLKKIVGGEDFQRKVGDLVRAIMFLGKSDTGQELIKTMEAFLEEVEKLPSDVLEEENRARINKRAWAEGGEYAALM